MNFQRAKNLFAGEQGGSLKSKLDMKSKIFMCVHVLAVYWHSCVLATDAISLNFSSVEITPRGTEQDSACQSDLSTMNSLQPCIWATLPAAILENSEKMGSSALPHYTPGSLTESFMTRTRSQNMLGASQEFRSASLGLGQSTTGFNHG